MRKGLPLVGLLVLGSTGASAGPDTVGVGSGRNGALTVSANGTLVNAYAPLTAPVARKALALFGGEVSNELRTRVGPADVAAIGMEVMFVILFYAGAAFFLGLPLALNFRRLARRHERAT